MLIQRLLTDYIKFRFMTSPLNRSLQINRI